VFPAERQGYSKRHVDAYIDKLHEEKKQVAETNNQLFLLWMKEYEKESSVFGQTAEHNLNGVTTKQQALMQLMEQSAEYGGATKVAVLKATHGAAQDAVQEASQTTVQSASQDAIQVAPQATIQGASQNAIQPASQATVQSASPHVATHDTLQGATQSATTHEPAQTATQQTTQQAETEKETDTTPQKKGSRIRSGIASLLFYILLAAALVGIFLVGSTADGSPRNLLGFSAMTVLTRSMQSEIPQNSIILTRHVDPTTIQVGDDITYLMQNNTTITHRVIGIHENYENSGMRGFETQGLMNENPDAEIVLAVNVIGRVIFHSLIIGRVILFIRANVFLIVILGVLAIALSISLRFWLTGRKDTKKVVRQT